MMAPRQRKRNAYTEKQLLEAISKIQNGTLSYRKASWLYNVPIGTLGDKIAGRRPLIGKIGRWYYTVNNIVYLLLLLVGAHVKLAYRGGQGSAPAQGVSARGVSCVCPSCQSQLPTMTIDSLQPGHGWPASRSFPGWTDLLRDHFTYRIGLREPYHVSK